MVRFRRRVLCALVSVFICGVAAAQTTWTNGGGDQVWSDSENWTPGEPTWDGTFNLVFNLDSGPITSTIDEGTGSVATLSITGGSFGGMLLNDSGGVLVIGTSFTDSSSRPVTVETDITGAGSVSNTGSAVLSLAMGDEYSGGTILRSGTLAIGSSFALGSGSVELDGGTNFTTMDSGPYSVANAVTLPNVGLVGILQGNSGATLELDGLISGVGGMEVATGTDGRNTIILTNESSTFAGGVTVDAGNTTLVIGASSSGPAGNPLSGPFGTGALALGGGTNLTSLDEENFTIGNEIFFLDSGPVTLLGNLEGGATLELDGPIVGSGSFEIAQAGDGQNTVILTAGSSTFTGGVTVDGGRPRSWSARAASGRTGLRSPGRSAPGRSRLRAART